MNEELPQSGAEFQLNPSPVWAGVAALRLHFGFNWWANSRILIQATYLTPEQLQAPNQTTHDSAYQLLLHSLDSEWGWRIVCQEGVKSPFLWKVEKFEDIFALGYFWKDEAARMTAYLDGLTDADLSREIDYGMLLAEPPRSVKATVLNLLSHILYHSANHRSELAVYLTQCGRSPGDLDMLDYLQAVSEAQ